MPSSPTGNVVKGRVKPYLKVGSADQFENRYDPVSKSDYSILHERHEIPDVIDINHVWTIIECDNGKWIVCPGFHFVNRTGYYLICKNARGEGFHRDYWYE